MRNDRRNAVDLSLEFLEIFFRSQMSDGRGYAADLDSERRNRRLDRAGSRGSPDGGFYRRLFRRA